MCRYVLNEQKNTQHRCHANLCNQHCSNRGIATVSNKEKSDKFVDDRGNLGEYLGEGIRDPNVRLQEEVIVVGNSRADNDGEYLKESMLKMESSLHRHGLSIANMPHTQSSLNSWSDMIGRVWKIKVKSRFRK